MIGIYKITSPTQKIYIGQSVDIYARWKKYNFLNCGNQTKLLNSFKKYGVESHQFEILENCDALQLNKRERYWQEYYDVVANGLNCKFTKTNDKSGFISVETKSKMSKSHKGKIMSKEARIKMSNSKKNMSDETKNKISTSQKGKNIGISNPFYGRTHTNETKQLIREKRKHQIFSEETKNKISNRLKKYILQFTLDGEFVAEYPSRNDAAKSLNINPTTISNNISGRKKSAGGYIWRYKD